MGYLDSQGPNLREGRSKQLHQRAGGGTPFKEEIIWSH